MLAVERTLNNRTILSYGILSLPVGMIGIPMGIYLAPFYAGELGSPLAAVGTMLMLSRLSDFVTDPIVGLLSDRWNPAMGRRKVWLPIGTLVMMTGVYLLFRPPGGIGPVYFLLAVSCTYLGYTVLMLPYHAWAAELSPHYHERTRVVASSRFFDTAGLVISTFIPAYVLSRPGATSGDIMFALSTYFLIGLPICVSITFFSVKERRQTVLPSEALTVKAALQLLSRNRPLALVVAAVFIATFAEVFRQTTTVFFADEIIGADNVGLIYVVYFVVALALIPVWSRLANRIEKHRALALALCVVVLTNFAMLLLSPGQVAAFTVLFALKGACYGALALLPIAMIADTADIETALTGRRSQGLIFGIKAMVQKLAYAAGQGVPLIALGWLGFNAEGGNGPEELYWLKLMYSIVPAAIALAAIAVLLPYSLTAARHKQLQRYLAAVEKGQDAELPAFRKQPADSLSAGGVGGGDEGRA